MRLYALDSVDIDPLRADLMARLEYHRDRFSRFERILKKRFAQGPASTADTGKLLGLRMGLRYERAVAEWCEEALDTLPAGAQPTNVHALDGGQARKSTANPTRPGRRWSSVRPPPHGPAARHTPPIPGPAM